jgi:hypothetical protein
LGVAIRLHTAALTCVLLLAAALGLARAGDADAYTAPPEGWGAAYERAAIEYWGEETTRCEHTTISFDSQLPLSHRLAEGGGQVLGRATVATVPGGHCYLWIAPLEGRGIYFRCILFAHEYGHWLGYGDEPDTPWRSVRAELLGSYTRDAPCRRLVAEASAGDFD